MKRTRISPWILKFLIFLSVSIFLGSSTSINENNAIDSSFGYKMGNGIIKKLDNFYFMGMWESASIYDKPFNYFENSDGKIYFHFQFDEGFMNLTLEILDGYYADKKRAQFVLSLTNNLSFSLIWSEEKKDINYSRINSFSLDQQINNCQWRYKIILYPFKNNEFVESQDLKISFILESQIPEESECDINIKGDLTVDNSSFQTKAIYYSLVMTLICVFKLYGIVNVLKKAAESDQEANKYSLLTIGLATTWDSYFFLFHLYEAMDKEILFHFFITPAFWYFILASIFEMRLLVILWRARYYEELMIGQAGRRHLCFYLQLYLLMFTFLFLIYYFILCNWWILIMNLFLLPQILHNAIRGQNGGFNWHYLLLFIGVRTIIPLYYRGCPYNLFQLTPSFPFCITLVSSMIFQLVVIYMQKKFGSRFFVPSFCLPPKYNYFVHYSVDLEMQIPQYDDCVICMFSLYEDPEQTLQDPLLGENNEIGIEKKVKKIIMKTPCNHRYHISCLLEWSKVKLECPTCRKRLPPME